MTLHELKAFLPGVSPLLFQLPDGTCVPAHFHVTEVGEVAKTFVDCGGTLRRERKVSLQLWNANDYDHRLHPEKLVSILELAERQLGLSDDEIEVEYQGDNGIVKFGLAAGADRLLLTQTNTACLALEACGVPGVATVAKSAVNLKNLITGTSGCTPGGGCC